MPPSPMPPTPLLLTTARLRAPLSSLAFLLCLVPSAAAQKDYKPLIEQGHFLRARVLVDSTLRASPTDVPALVAKSQIQMAFDQPDAAVDTAQHAVALRDSSVEAHAQLTIAVGLRIANSRVSFLQKVKGAFAFKREADRTLQLDPNNLDVLFDMGGYYWFLPGIAGGDKKKSQSIADKLLQLDPVKGASLKALYASQESDKNKRFAALESIWRQAIAARPASYEAHSELADVLINEPDKRPETEAELNRALALDPTRIGAYRLLAILYVMQTRWPDLDALLKRARAAVPDDRAPDFQAARFILINKNDAQLPLAEHLLRDYLTQPAEGDEPTWAAAHWRLGLVLEREGHKPEAIAEIQTAVNMDPYLENAKKDLTRLKH